MTQLVKIIHRPCCEHLHVGTIFFVPNQSRLKYQHAEEGTHRLTEEGLASVIAWGANIDGVILSFQIDCFVVVALITTNQSTSIILERRRTCLSSHQKIVGGRKTLQVKYVFLILG